MAVVQITRSLLDKLDKTPAEREVVYTDQKIKGFAVKHTPTGRIIYMVYTRIVGGRPYKKKIGEYPTMTLTDARKIAAKMINEIKSGHDPDKRNADEGASVTLKQVWDDYMATRKLAPKTRRQYLWAFERHFSDWYDKPIQSITRKDCEDRYHQVIANCQGHSYKSQTEPGLAHAQYVFRILNAVCRFAMAEEIEPGLYLLRKNPVAVLGEKRLRRSIPPKDTKLPLHRIPEYLRLCRAMCKEVVADYVTTLLLTGMRSVEARTMTWEMIDWDSRCIIIPTTKTHRPLVHPMSSFLWDIMIRRADQAAFGSEDYLDPKGWVFPSWKVAGTAISDIRKALKPVNERFGGHYSPHDFRRTFISTCSILGIDEHIAKRLVNHTNGDVHYGYKHFSPEELRPVTQNVAIYMMVPREDREIGDEEWRQEMEDWAEERW